MAGKQKAQMTMKIKGTSYSQIVTSICEEGSDDNNADPAKDTALLSSQDKLVIVVGDGGTAAGGVVVPPDDDDVLPEDLLADILGRLPACSLAASRCVRKKWCAVIDARRLLRTDLLPLRLDGFFFACHDQTVGPDIGFFSRPFTSTARKISTNVYKYLCLRDHCNGLLLSDAAGLLRNPATGQRVCLPDYPDEPFGVVGMVEDCFVLNFYLAYDPMVSPHYEVVIIPRVAWPWSDNNVHMFKESEWPPSPFRTHVFSSRKWVWEERTFVREGKAVATIADMRCFCCANWQSTQHHNAVYWRGALYVLCQNNSVMRMTLCNDKYQMIKSPIITENYVSQQAHAYLGKSRRGVYFALLISSKHDCWPWLRVWLLDVSGSDMGWVLKTDVSLQTMMQVNFTSAYTHKYDMAWITLGRFGGHVSATSIEEDESEWDFESAIVLHDEDANNKTSTTHYKDAAFFLGFHPYKEIVFLMVSSSRVVVSYHLNSSKVQELGISEANMEISIPYTPSWMEFASSPN